MIFTLPAPETENQPILEVLFLAADLTLPAGETFASTLKRVEDRMRTAGVTEGYGHSD